jgi:hypothetical protein
MKFLNLLKDPKFLLLNLLMYLGIVVVMGGLLYFFKAPHFVKYGFFTGTAIFLHSASLGWRATLRDMAPRNT